MVDVSEELITTRNPHDVKLFCEGEYCTKLFKFIAYTLWIYLSPQFALT